MGVPLQLFLITFRGDNTISDRLYVDNTGGILAKLRSNLTNSMKQMKHQVDKHRTNMTFQEGDLVYIKLQPYRQTFLTNRKNQKLSRRFSDHSRYGKGLDKWRIN